MDKDKIIRIKDFVIKKSRYLEITVWDQHKSQLEDILNNFNLSFHNPYIDHGNTIKYEVEKTPRTIKNSVSYIFKITVTKQAAATFFELGKLFYEEIECPKRSYNPEDNK